MTETDGMATGLAYRAIMAVDIERSAGRGNTAFFAAREALDAALRGAFSEAGIAWGAGHHHDLGDGLRVTLPADTPKARLLHPLVPELAARLRAHNRTAAEEARVRVRIAMHAGDVRLGPAGAAGGWPFEILARLLDAAPARAALAQAPSSVVAAVLVSRHFHDETVPHGYPGIDRERFQRVAFTAKEYAGEAWLHLAGHPTAPPWAGAGATGVPAPAPAPEPERPASPASPASEMPQVGGVSHMHNTASGHATLFASQNGGQHIHQHGNGA
ncbi:hypothetical protein SAMN06297387_106146 [Streptomyces zhaozhouensis]|uniref:Guanylate cyclase domain-containing protein n=1 Tax=Streptomyces zhaozhouensis TaxID=1300267 RepID=A0A286DV67_9ACTN|nr:hypothetical protein [Streptomyces zhaozhouensis]SOD62569.1 hypothetical protein SAMN06297387_106146 [Streptomyces zhaozhouensis]